MKTLVTGGSGYLGIYVRQFFGADDFSRRSGFDVRDEQAVERVADYDVVIHLAAHFDKHPDGAAECFRTNATGTANVIRNLKPGAVFIYASTKDVYDNHPDGVQQVDETVSTDYAGQSAFEWSKLIGERYVEYYAHAHKLRACIFRLSNVFARYSSENEAGFVTHYVESVKRRLPIRLPEADPVRDILYVDDFSRACRAFIDSQVQYGRYNLGGGQVNAISLRNLLKRIGTMIDIEPVIQEDAALPAPVPLNYVSNIARIEDELGWHPQVGIEDGLQMIL